MKRLTQFAESDGPFRVMPVIAPSGAGKTRLISEWMKHYSAKANQFSKWEAGILTSDLNVAARDPEPWSNWDIKKDTLIVIDYTYAFDEVVKAIAERAVNRSHRHGFKVRLIVIDHVMPKVLHEDFFWRGLAGGPRSSDRFQADFLERELRLEPEDDNSDMLRKIIAAAAKASGVEASDRAVSNALSHLDRMAMAQERRDVVRHPLFAALMGRSLRDPKVDFSTWTRRDLVLQYFSGQDRLPWVSADGKASETASEKALLGLHAGVPPSGGPV
ncbi:hypothetical protein J7443_15850 [Tropicibacter sp. R15_0]|uniref:hypothetical protein n=1 Tax=Tropicibacter sp. R15_0 TaxID=2821101 RepID=UPI001ADD4EFE|nr:hypothetical protein [Tropicibacter sp. R15_0]MBO9466717.1 hypothetical protein [Tropicibacter sp. R15_0]